MVENRKFNKYFIMFQVSVLDFSIYFSFSFTPYLLI